MLRHVRCRMCDSAGEAIQVLQRRRRGNVKSPCRIFHHQHFGIKVKIKRTARFCFLHGSFFNVLQRLQLLSGCKLISQSADQSVKHSVCKTFGQPACRRPT